MPLTIADEQLQEGIATTARQRSPRWENRNQVYWDSGQSLRVDRTPTSGRISKVRT